MAKTTGGLFSLGSSGSLAKTLTFSKWKGRPYVRQTVVPANPQTTAQTTTRSTFSNAGLIWKLGGPLLIAPWDRFASGQVLTGRNAFMGRFVTDNRGLADLQAMTFSPGAKGGLAPVSMTVTNQAGQLLTDMIAPAAPTGWTLQAGVSAVIKDQDPETGTEWDTQEQEDLAAPYTVTHAGLTAATQYVVAWWLRWVKPDGSIAYGPSIVDVGTPT